MKKLLFYVAMGVMPLLFVQCTFKDDLNALQNSFDSVQLYIGSPEFITSVHIEFVDAKTNEPITNKVINVTLAGKDVQSVYNNIGFRRDKYSARSGLLDLVIDPHLNNTIGTSPVSFTVTSNVEGYAPVTQNIEISEAKRTWIIVPLIKFDNPPEGVTVVSKDNVGQTDSENGFVASTNIQFFPKRSFVKSSISSVESTIEIPNGIRFFDDNGLPLTGELWWRCWFENFRNGTSKVIFDADGLFQHYASLGIQFLVKPRNSSELIPVSSVSGGTFTYVIGFPDDYLNPITKAALKVGDSFQRTSYVNGLNNSTTTELATDIVNGSNGGQFLEFSTMALSLEWSEMLSQVCNNGPVFKFEMDAAESDAPLFYHSVKWRDINIFKNKERIFKPALTFRAPYLPVGKTTHSFSPINTSNGDVEWRFTPESIVVDNSCDNKEYIIKATKVVKPGLDLIDVHVTFTVLSESNTQVAIKPNIWLNYSKVGHATSTNQSQMVNGEITLHNILVDGNTEYNLGVSFGDDYYTGKMYCKKENGKYVLRFGFDDFQTENFTRSSIQSGNSKMIEIDYKLTLADDIFNQIKQ